MADLIAIVPTRGRPESVGPLVEAFRATCTADTELHLAVDDNDPRIDEYSDSIRKWLGAPVSMCHVESPSNMVRALNGTAAANLRPSFAPFAFAFLGDDHMPRTHGWDAAYLAALREMGSGLVYGDDLLQGERLPTQIAITADIVRAWGWIAPPELAHLYVDNFWLDLGRAAGCIRYLPDVVVEHRHPVARKAAWDAGYDRVNHPDSYERDRLAYEAFHADGGFDRAVAAVKALRGAA